MKKLIIITVIILTSAITAWSFNRKDTTEKTKVSADIEKSILSNTPHRNDIGSAD
jgi:hypothetical protein